MRERLAPLPCRVVETVDAPLAVKEQGECQNSRVFMCQRSRQPHQELSEGFSSAQLIGCWAVELRLGNE